MCWFSQAELSGGEAGERQEISDNDKSGTQVLALLGEEGRPWALGAHIVDVNGILSWQCERSGTNVSRGDVAGPKQSKESTVGA